MNASALLAGLIATTDKVLSGNMPGVSGLLASQRPDPDVPNMPPEACVILQSARRIAIAISSTAVILLCSVCFIAGMECFRRSARGSAGGAWQPGGRHPGRHAQQDGCACAIVLDTIDHSWHLKATWCQRLFALIPHFAASINKATLSHAPHYCRDARCRRRCWNPCSPG